MSLEPTLNKGDLVVSKFIDFDKSQNTFFDNVYLEDYKIVIKMPLGKNRRFRKEFKIQKFSLENCSFLLSYE